MAAVLGSKLTHGEAGQEAGASAESRSAPPDRPALLLLAAAFGLLLALARPVLATWFAAFPLSDADYAYTPLIPP